MANAFFKGRSWVSLASLFIFNDFIHWIVQSVYANTISPNLISHKRRYVNFILAIYSQYIVISRDVGLIDMAELPDNGNNSYRK